MANTGFTRPTLTELAERTRSDINSGLPGADARLRRSFLGVLARALAGLAHGLYGYLEWIALQSVPDTATGSGLNSWGRVWGVSRKLATKSAGTVTIRFMMDNTYPTGIPESADVTAVQAYIDEPSRRPVTAEVFVAAPVAVGLDITITGLTPNTAAVKVSVESALRDMIRRVAEPGGTIPVSKIWEAISIAAGEEKHVVTIPSADVTHDTGEIATLGTVTYA